jgi:hypothetical protein
VRLLVGLTSSHIGCGIFFLVAAVFGSGLSVVFGMILGVLESSVVAAGRVVMDSMAALRVLEFSGGAQMRIDGLRTRRMVRRQCDVDSLELGAGLDRDGEFAGRGVRAQDAVGDLLG